MREKRAIPLGKPCNRTEDNCKGTTNRLVLIERKYVDIVEIAGGLNGFESDVTPVLRKLGASWPALFAGAESTENGIDVFRISPTKVLILAQDKEIWSTCESLVRRTNLAATSLSSSRKIIRMSGVLVTELLSRLCPIDFHCRAFPANGFAQTAIHGVPVLVHRRSESDSESIFDVVVPRSYAASIFDWIEIHAIPPEKGV